MKTVLPFVFLSFSSLNLAAQDSLSLKKHSPKLQKEFATWIASYKALKLPDFIFVKLTELAFTNTDTCDCLPDFTLKKAFIKKSPSAAYAVDIMNECEVVKDGNRLYLDFCEDGGPVFLYNLETKVRTQIFYNSFSQSVDESCWIDDNLLALAVENRASRKENKHRLSIYVLNIHTGKAALFEPVKKEIAVRFSYSGYKLTKYHIN